MKTTIIKAELINEILNYSRKVVQYPKGHDAFCPTDMILLKKAINKLDKFNLDNPF